MQAVVTSHLVVRGSYRSLTLVIYGNTAEDLGQFNIEFDLDSSLANLVCSPSEGKLEDLPPALRSAKLTFEESISSLKSLSLSVSEQDLSVEMKQFLQLVLKIFELSDLGDAIHKVVNTVTSVVSSYVGCDFHGTNITLGQYNQANSINCKEDSKLIVTEAKNELLELYKLLQHGFGNLSAEEGIILESEAALATPELLMEVLNKYFCFKKESTITDLPLLSQVI